MRTSKKASLIQKAVEIIEADGLNALTYESLSQASGISKSGLIYHFPSRDALLSDLGQFFAEQWEQQLIETAGGSADEVSQTERFRASLKVLSQNAARADLLIALELLARPDLQISWHEMLERWAPRAEDIASDPKLYLYMVIADGLWVHDHVNTPPLSPQQRQLLIASALKLLED